LHQPPVPAYISYMKQPSAANSSMPGSDAGESTSLFFALVGTANELIERLESALTAVGLSRAKMGALDVLLKAGEPMPLRVLAERQHCAPSNITTLIDRLTSDGLVIRTDDPQDRRSKLATLTPLGRERTLLGLQVVQKVQEEFEGTLSSEQQASLRRILAALSR